ncbi:MAG TPA: hydroxysqualene dehydroxylase HpnE [Burkholderiales bacterium]|nr:hydroxysqualene dehydroxylase HpnE [Burkholderiales bacterium]
MENLGHRVAVVGAGYAGMAAAVALAGHGVRATVFESAAVPGGRARRVRISSLGQGNELDNGQHILIGAYSALFGMMRTVGVPASALLRLPLELRYAREFRFRRLALPAPLGLAAGLLTARGLSFAERISAARFIARMRGQRFSLARDVPVSELLAANAQSGRIAHYLWRPLCVSALNTPPELASAQVFLTTLRDTLGGAAEASDLLLPRVDLSRLFPEPAADFVRARGGDIRLQTPVKDLGALRQSFDRVIVAVGPHQLKTLLPEAPEYSYQPIYTCYLQYAAEVALPFPMLGLDDGLVQWVFDRGALLGEKGRLACVISAQGDHQQLALDELAVQCERELAAVLPGLGKPQWSRVIAEKRATVTCSPGGKALPSCPPGVFLAGDYTDSEYPPTLEAAVRSGVRAAKASLGT